MSTTYVRLAAAVHAEQWDQSDGSLRRIQDLLRPFSPFRTSHLWPALSPSIGVPVRIGMGGATSLVFAEPGQWIVKDPVNGFAIYTDQAFRELFVAQPSDMHLDEMQAHHESLRDA